MARTASFEANTERYEQWFERHDAAYRSELVALRQIAPSSRLELEIGVGTGRFAEPLGIAVGLDPSPRMLASARTRGVNAVRGVAEALPFRDGVFDLVLIVTTICFVDDAHAMLREARRVLSADGSLIVGFIDRESRLGRYYQTHQDENVFYRDAVFFSAAEVEALLAETGFVAREWVQTLSAPLAQVTGVERPRAGHGEGAFVAVRAGKSAEWKGSVEAGEEERGCTSYHRSRGATSLP